jgi:hypothetical protein
LLPPSMTQSNLAQIRSLDLEGREAIKKKQ